MSNKSKLKPDLRFPEFLGKGDWETKTLNELGELINGLTYSPNDVRDEGLLVLRSSNIQNGILVFNDCVFVRTNIKGANISQPKDILICVRNGSKRLIGKNAIIPESIPLATHGAFMTVFRASNPDFVFQLFQSNAYDRQVKADLGATINSINSKNFIRYEFNVPSNPLEQRKIASCLSTLDELIIAQNKKLDVLKDHKKGLMQNLFPQEGETVPKVRFPEFENHGEWVETTLEEVADYENGKAHEKDIDENGNYIVVNSKFISSEGETVKYSDAAYCPTNLGDILMVLSDVPNGKAIAKCFYVDEENRFSVNQRICRITATDCDSRFLFYIMDRSAYFLSFDDGVKQTNLRKSDVLEFPFRIPTDSVEQTKIASCISAIDDLIRAQTLRIEELNQHKSGLMQGLFPKIEN